MRSNSCDISLPIFNSVWLLQDDKISWSYCSFRPERPVFGDFQGASLPTSLHTALDATTVTPRTHSSNVASPPSIQTSRSGRVLCVSAQTPQLFATLNIRHPSSTPCSCLLGIIHYPVSRASGLFFCSSFLIPSFDHLACFLATVQDNFTHNLIGLAPI